MEVHPGNRAVHPTMQAAHWRSLVIVLGLSITAVVALEVTTGLIDVRRFTWDNVRYIRMAETMFEPEAMVSPFAYRWGTPLLARFASDALGVSLVTGFRLIAWTGAVCQLVSVYYLVLVVTRSTKAAWAGWFATLLSVWNVRFLMFDPFRPDHLAYPMVILASLAVARRRWGWVIALTLLGAPFREFTVIPLLAVIAVLILGREWRGLLRWGAPFAVTLAIAVVAPRLLITTVDSRQTVDVGSFDSDIVRLLLFWQRHINIVLGYFSYAVPALMLFSVRRWQAFWTSLDVDFRRYLAAYSTGVFALVFMGGTDIHRFVTFMVVPLALLVGGLAQQARPIELVVALAGVVWFNRLAEPIPDRVINEYKDFWGGWSGRINDATASRITAAVACVCGGQLARFLSNCRSMRVTPIKKGDCGATTIPEPRRPQQQ